MVSPVVIADFLLSWYPHHTFRASGYFTDACNSCTIRCSVSSSRVDVAASTDVVKKSIHASSGAC